MLFFFSYNCAAQILERFRNCLPHDGQEMVSVQWAEVCVRHSVVVVDDQQNNRSKCGGRELMSLWCPGNNSALKPSAGMIPL